MKRIGIDNKIFQSDEYQKDKYKFYLITQNLKSPNVELYSDEENYVVCRGEIGWPTWIWTRDNLDTSLLKEIEMVIEHYLTDDEKDKFTCKKELYDLLVQDNYEFLNTDYFEMGTLSCKKTIKPRDTDGYMDIPKEEDKQILVRYWYDDSQEMNGMEPITWEQANLDVDRFYESQNFYVWRNESGKIVCMAHYSVADGQAKLSHVYTPDEERKKGYAANLIYTMTNVLLDKGYVPLLYTDYNYIPSNKAYINAGYEDTGILINFSCSKAKRNVRTM